MVNRASKMFRVLGLDPPKIPNQGRKHSVSETRSPVPRSESHHGKTERFSQSEPKLLPPNDLLSCEAKVNAWRLQCMDYNDRPYCRKLFQDNTESDDLTFQISDPKSALPATSLKEGSPDKRVNLNPRRLITANLTARIPKTVLENDDDNVPSNTNLKPSGNLTKSSQPLLNDPAKSKKVNSEQRPSCIPKALPGNKFPEQLSEPSQTSFKLSNTTKAKKSEAKNPCNSKAAPLPIKKKSSQASSKGSSKTQKVNSISTVPTAATVTARVPKSVVEYDSDDDVPLKVKENATVTARVPKSVVEYDSDDDVPLKVKGKGLADLATVQHKGNNLEEQNEIDKSKTSTRSSENMSKSSRSLLKDTSNSKKVSPEKRPSCIPKALPGNKFPEQLSESSQTPFKLSNTTTAKTSEAKNHCDSKAASLPIKKKSSQASSKGSSKTQKVNSISTVPTAATVTARVPKSVVEYDSDDDVPLKVKEKGLADLATVQHKGNNSEEQNEIDKSKTSTRSSENMSKSSRSLLKDTSNSKKVSPEKRPSRTPKAFPSPIPADPAHISFKTPKQLSESSQTSSNKAKNSVSKKGNYEKILVTADCRPSSTSTKKSLSPIPSLESNLQDTMCPRTEVLKGNSQTFQFKHPVDPKLNPTYKQSTLKESNRASTLSRLKSSVMKQPLGASKSKENLKPQDKPSCSKWKPSTSSTPAGRKTCSNLSAESKLVTPRLAENDHNNNSSFEFTILDLSEIPLSSPNKNQDDSSSTTVSSCYRLRKRNLLSVVHQSDDSKSDSDVVSISSGSNFSDTEYPIRNLMKKDTLNVTVPFEDNCDVDGSGSDEESVILTLPKTSKKMSKKNANKKQAATPGNENNIDSPSPWNNEEILEKVIIPVTIPPTAETVLEPIEYFQYFFPDSLLEQIVDFTNTFATWKSGGKKSLNLSLSELKTFLGIWMYMGVNQLPGLRDYWGSETCVPQVSEFMTFNRFQSIRSSLHLFDKTQENLLDRDDRYAKVRLLLDHMKEKCNKLHQESYFSIDEAMVPYKGKYAGTLRQFIKSKPHKFGIKIFHLAGSSGLIYDFIPYAGALTFKDVMFSDEENTLGVGAKVVISLARNIKNPDNSALFFDNYFSSVKLVRHLKENMNIHSTGTVRSDRLDHCPLSSDKALKKSGRGSYEFKNNDGVCIVKWLDSKVVHMVSTIAGVEPLTQAHRYDKHLKKHNNVPMPRVIQLYNQKMGGVDLNDMLVELHRSPTRCKRWYLCLIGYMMDVAVVNSYLLYKRDIKSFEQEKNSDEEEAASEIKVHSCSKTFRLSISKSLRGASAGATKFASGPKPKVIKQPRGLRPDDSIRYDRIDHWPTFKNSQSRCKYCKTGFTTVCCVKCQEISLCFVPTRQCFIKFHLKDMQ